MNVKSVAAAAAETKEIEEVKTQAADTTDGKAVAEKPKAAAKAPDKSLPELMEEGVIPSLKKTLEAQQDITQLDLSFNDNTVSLNIFIDSKVFQRGREYNASIVPKFILHQVQFLCECHFPTCFCQTSILSSPTIKHHMKFLRSQNFVLFL